MGEGEGSGPGGWGGAMPWCFTFYLACLVFHLGCRLSSPWRLFRPQGSLVWHPDLLVSYAIDLIFLLLACGVWPTRGLAASAVGIAKSVIQSFIRRIWQLCSNILEEMDIRHKKRILSNAVRNSPQLANWSPTRSCKARSCERSDSTSCSACRPPSSQSDRTGSLS